MGRSRRWEGRDKQEEDGEGAYKQHSSTSAETGMAKLKWLTEGTKEKKDAAGVYVYVWEGSE